MAWPWFGVSEWGWIKGEGRRGGYHLRTADFEDLAGARSQGRLAPDHVGAVAQHRHAHERVAILVPPHDGRVVGGGFGGCRVVVGAQLALPLLFGLQGQVDVPNLKVELHRQVDARHLGHDAQCFGVLPGVVNEGGVPGRVLGGEFIIRARRGEGAYLSA